MINSMTVRNQQNLLYCIYMKHISYVYNICSAQSYKSLTKLLFFMYSVFHF